MKHARRVNTFSCHCIICRMPYNHNGCCHIWMILGNYTRLLNKEGSDSCVLFVLLSSWDLLRSCYIVLFQSCCSITVSLGLFFIHLRSKPNERLCKWLYFSFTVHFMEDLINLWDGKKYSQTVKKLMEVTVCKSTDQLLKDCVSSCLEQKKTQIQFYGSQNEHLMSFTLRSFLHRSGRNQLPYISEPLRDLTCQCFSRSLSFSSTFKCDWLYWPSAVTCNNSQRSYSEKDGKNLLENSNKTVT